MRRAQSPDAMDGSCSPGRRRMPHPVSACIRRTRAPCHELSCLSCSAPPSASSRQVPSTGSGQVLSSPPGPFSSPPRRWGPISGSRCRRSRRSTERTVRGGRERRGWRAVRGDGGVCAPCHEMSCFVMVRRASDPVAARPYRACRSSIAFRSAPFRSRRRPGRGGTLFRAYRARPCAGGRARLCAGAVRAPDCPRAQPRNQGAPFPSVSQGFLKFAPARTGRGRSHTRMPLPQVPF